MSTHGGRVHADQPGDLTRSIGTRVERGQDGAPFGGSIIETGTDSYRLATTRAEQQAVS